MKPALSPAFSGAGNSPAASVTTPDASAVWAAWAAICSEIEERLSLSACSFDSNASIVSRRCASSDLQFSEARLGRFLGGGDFLLGGGDRVARVFDLRARRGQPADRALDFVAQRLDPADDGVVVALDPVQVFGLRRHVRPVFGFEDRVEDVGRARLVDRDEPFAQGRQRLGQLGADFDQVFAFRFERLGGGFEFFFFGGELGLDRCLLLRAAPRLRRSSS